MVQVLFSRPGSVAQAVELLADGNAVALAGGTDYFASRVGHLPEGRLVDLTGIAALRGVSRQADGSWRIVS